jgi:hypothetical protein
LRRALYEAIASRASSRAFRVWLGATVRRWLALASAVATVTGAVTFLASEHVAPLLLVDIALFLLLLVLGFQEYGMQRVKRQDLLALERLITSGQAILLHADDEKSLKDWPDWVERAGNYLFAQVGLQALYDFHRVSDGEDPSGGAGGLGRPSSRLTFSTRGCLKAQLALLEGLRHSLL